MKVLLVSNYKVEEGRGPMFRLMNLIPFLSNYCDIELLSFGEVDDIIKKLSNKLKIKVHKTTYISEGWFVKNSKEIALAVKKIATKNEIDLVILTWEIWDIAVAIYETLKNTGVKYIVTMHSIPFATALIKTNSYTFDCLKKFFLEKRFMIKKYMLLRNYQSKKYIKKFNILTMTKTVEFKLKKYFGNLNLYLSYPGYATQIPKPPDKINYKYDFIYMAKFEYGKGIFDFIKITKELVKKDKGLKFAVVGSFTFKDEEIKFFKKIKKYRLENNICFLGWKNGREKYNAVFESKIFLYPSFAGDTFSQCLLEALACGKKVICYDVPFTRDNFSIKTVIKIPVFKYKKFSEAAYNSLNEKKYIFQESILFVKKHYNSWDLVARAEYNCYKEVVNEKLYKEKIKGKGNI